MAFVLPFTSYFIGCVNVDYATLCGKALIFDDFCLSFSAFLASNSLNCSDCWEPCHGHVLFSFGSGWMLQKSLLGCKEGKRNAGFHGMRRHS